MPLSCALNVVKMVNFKLCVFTTIKNIFKKGWKVGLEIQGSVAQCLPTGLC